MAFKTAVSLDWNEPLFVGMNDAVQDASLVAAKEVESIARALVPVDEGDLKASIKAFKSKFKDGGAIVLAGSKKAFYAHMVEYGTVVMAPKPFLRPALMKSKNASVKIIQAALIKATK